MLRSILLKTLRDQRWAALAWGGGLALLVLVTATGWAHAYPDETSRQRAAAQIESGFTAFRVFYGEPRALDSLGGFVEWRALGIFPVLLGLFIVIAATGVTRGAEERGETDVVLTATHGRGRLFTQQSSGLALALIGVCLLIWLALLAAGGAAGESALSPGRAALAVLNVGLAAALFGAVALLAAQLARTRRAAAVGAGIVMFAAFVWNNLGLAVGRIDRLRPISPMYLTSRSSPLADGRVDGVAMALVALLALGCTALAGWLFLRRDLGAAVRLPLPGALRRLLRPAAGIGGAWLLGSPLARGLRTSLGPAVLWGAALGVYAALIAGLAPSVTNLLDEQATPREILERLQGSGLSTQVSFLSAAFATLITALVAVFAITLAIGWSGEERAGRLEVELTSPISRRRYFVQRTAAALLAAVVAVAITGVAFMTAVWLAGVELEWGRALAAVVVLAPLGGVVVAFGFALSGWRPVVVAAVLPAAVAVSFFMDLLAPLFSLPDAVRTLSAFNLYGQPLVEGVRWGSLVAMLVLIAAFTVVGAVAFSRRDIVK